MYHELITSKRKHGGLNPPQAAMKKKKTAKMVKDHIHQLDILWKKAIREGDSKKAKQFEERLKEAKIELRVLSSGKKQKAK